MPNIQKTDDEWRAQLTPEQYRVLREKGTEPAFTGEYVTSPGDGSYTCAACGKVLFDSETKFESNSGWPSFYDALPGTVDLHEDTSLGMVRTEATCANCGSHLGHVFEGEAYGNPTNKRYCISSLSLQFNQKENK